MFQEAGVGQVFKDKDYLSYFKVIIVGHNDQYTRGINPGLNECLLGRNPQRHAFYMRLLSPLCKLVVLAAQSFEVVLIRQDVKRSLFS